MIEAVKKLFQKPKLDLSLPALLAEYQRLYQQASIQREHLAEVSVQVGKILINRAEYEKVQAITQIPWPVVASIHSLECNLSFKCHLHNGDPLTAKTVRVPKNRPLTGRPPYQWYQSAIDAFSDRAKPEKWDISGALWFMENYNGWGYRKFHPYDEATKKGHLTPYLWSYTSLGTLGKYTADGKFDKQAASKQIGSVCILNLLDQRGVTELTLS